MIKSALQYIVGLNKPCVQEIGGHTYSDKKLERITFNPKATTIRMHTLSSLVEYIRSDTDTLSAKMLLHVVSPDVVRLISCLDGERLRETVVEVVASVPAFNYNRFMDHEAFLISVQTKFQGNDDRELILKFAGLVENGTVESYGDDGITQKATMKTGLVSKASVVVPNPVKLRAFRTFVEVEQPETSYVFRMRSDAGSVECALFEADGGAWEIEAMKKIKAYLQQELKEFPFITVIS